MRADQSVRSYPKMSNVSPRQHLRSIERTNERHEGREEFVCLDRNERASPFPDHLLREMLSSISSRDLTAYPDPGPFVSRVVEYLESEYPEDWIVETAGSDAALRRILMAYLRPGGTVVFPNPSYAMYDLYTRVFEGISKPVDYRADRSLAIEDLLAAIVERTNVVVIGNPNQPTGTTMLASLLERVVAQAAKVGALCVVDEAYYPFHAETMLPSVRKFDNLIVIRTLSKYPGVAGLRLGYAVAPPHLIKGLIAVRGGSEISGVSLAIGCYLLSHRKIAEEFRVGAEAGRQLLVERARQLGFEAPECAANFQLLRCPAAIDPGDLTGALKRRKYLVKSGFGHPSMRHCVRVSVDGPDIIKPFLVALESAAREVAAKDAVR
jgi:histidinol-phosphate aminotransferase